MRTVLGVLTVVLASLGSASPQDQIATVTSTSKFHLRGASITPAQGVPTWPVLAGDSVKSGTAQTIVTYSDGSTLVLDPGSVATVEAANGTPVFRLLRGSASYSLRSLTSVELLATDQRVNVSKLNGSYSIGGQKSAGFWTPGHTAAVVGGAVAVGTAAGLGVGAAASNSSGSQVSPSH
jgi:hypothetical protein